MIVENIIQPGDASTLATIRAVFKREQVSQIDVAAAYMTASGVNDLLKAIAAAAGPSWDKVQKRWLTSFDYSRTHPLALRIIRELPKSEVRINDAERLLSNKCTPSKPFHPKVLIFRGKTVDCVLAGSGNVSRSGLSKGHEAGILIRADRPEPAQPSVAGKSIKSFRSWFRGLWQDAAPLDNGLFGRYERHYESVPNQANPTPTDDDIVPLVTRPRQLTPEQIRKLRVCRHFWIEGGNITPNLGDGRPGNQLMMKRFSRVYFGILPVDVPKNSALGHVGIVFDGKPERQCSLTFSDNLMDKLTLPIPGAEGPPKYDNENLLFRRIGPETFQLSLGTKAAKAAWVKRSKSIGAFFIMPPGQAPRGREWGVF